MSKGLVMNIERETLKNNNFRKVLFTGKHSQVVVMSLKPGEEIGAEVHPKIDQFFRFEKGQGYVVMDGTGSTVGAGDIAVVGCGTRHNVTNTSKTKPLKLYTVYSPPAHKDGVVQKNKEDPERVP
jgi:mannose-6-phosphate isomerase-like protein (cupin superfamily)